MATDLRRDPALHRRLVQGVRLDPCRNHQGTGPVRPTHQTGSTEEGDLAPTPAEGLAAHSQPVRSWSSVSPCGPSSYSFVQRVMAVRRQPSATVLPRVDPGIVDGPAMESPANRTNTLHQYSFVQRVIVVSRSPNLAVLDQAASRVAAGPATTSPDDRTKTDKRAPGYAVVIMNPLSL